MSIARKLIARTAAPTPVARTLVVHAHPPSQTPRTHARRSPTPLPHPCSSHARLVARANLPRTRPSCPHHLCARAPPLPSHGHSSCTRTHARRKHSPYRTHPAPFRRPALADEPTSFLHLHRPVFTLALRTLHPHSSPHALRHPPVPPHSSLYFTSFLISSLRSPPSICKFCSR
ncbi:hypothetical protein K438DRAFT_1870451 [Mycena galopus ATCC 62051]|nr:hypothetical protein K438DRAFT_1870451 [Mycena galopus ATCC 62051]